MKKKYLLYCLLGILMCNAALAQKKEKITREIIGNWKFSTELNEAISKDSCQVYMMYKFREDGRVEIKSMDESKCDNWPMLRFWTIIKMRDTRGTQYFGVRITEEQMPERESYDDFTFGDKIFLISHLKNGNLSWVEKDPYNRPSLKDVITYSKILL